MKPIIEVNNLSKKYKFGTRQPYYSLRDTLTGLMKNPFALLKQKRIDEEGLVEDEFWALEDVSFHIMPREVIGIIGRNGAGKTTLLKLLSQITPPTKGEIVLRGRVASLLEVGTGFHPELTGRENIYLNGAILGMKRTEINKKFDEIVDFAEIEKFLDTQVKHFSSGMYMRLAFSVAGYLDSEILIVDEVLSVGDIEFQKKCFKKMTEVGKQGRTILLVSHNMSVIASLCSRAIFLSEGSLFSIGKTDAVIGAYQSQFTDDKRHSLKNRKDRTGSGLVRITNIYIRDLTKKKLNFVESGKPIEFVINANVEPEAINQRVSINLIIIDRNEYRILPLRCDTAEKGFLISGRKMRFICRINEGLPLIGGTYGIVFSVLIGDILADKVIRAFEFEIVASSFSKSIQMSDISMGSVIVANQWYIERN